MTTMKFALISLTFFVLVEVYNARRLYESLPLSQVAVIQMDTREEKLQLLQSTSLSSSYEQATYIQVSLPPPPRRMPPPKGQATYGRVPIPPPPPPRRSPPKGQATYVRVNPPPPPPPDDGPSPISPTSYPEDKPNSNNEIYNVAIEEPESVSMKESWPLSLVAIIQMVIGEEKLRLPQSTPLSSSYEKATYNRVNVPPPPPPRMQPPKGQATYGRVPIPPPPPPRRPPPKGQAAYVRVSTPPPPPIDDGPPPIVPTSSHENKPNTNNESYNVAIEEPEGSLVVEVSPKQDSSMGQTKHGQDDPRAQPSSDPNDSQVPGMYDQVKPSAPAVAKPAHPKHPLLSDGGSACTGLSASTIDGRTNLSPPQAPFMLPSYITSVFKYWG